MPLDDITDPQAVHQAMAEYRDLGRDAFLKRYGFGRSRGWVLVDDGITYDAKAVLGAAHSFQFPTSGTLPGAGFRGGGTVAAVLRHMGFTVKEPEQESRNPVWSRDELILALDLYVRHRPSQPGPRHADVVALSNLLNRIGQLSGSARNAVYRNPNGVAMKLQNFRRLDPDQEGKGLKAGGRGEESVWNTFIDIPERLRATAAAIEASLPELEGIPPEAADEGDEAEEGALLTRLHRFRERDRGIIERRKANALKETGKLACEACGFDFQQVYGERGRQYIECHHIKPVSALKTGEKTRVTDLALLCANCHRMIHVARPWLTVADLKSILEAPAAGQRPYAG